MALLQRCAIVKLTIVFVMHGVSFWICLSGTIFSYFSSTWVLLFDLVSWSSRCPKVWIHGWAATSSQFRSCWVSLTPLVSRFSPQSQVPRESRCSVSRLGKVVGFLPQQKTVVSTHTKNISQFGNLPQIGMNIKNVWNHHLVMIVVFLSRALFQCLTCSSWWFFPPIWKTCLSKWVHLPQVEVEKNETIT